MTYGEYYLQQDLEGRRKLLKRLVGSLHLEPATRQRQRHFDMERIPDRYRLDPGDWDVVMEAGREYVPVGEREDNPPEAWIPADEPIVLAEGERERLGLDSDDEEKPEPIGTARFQRFA
jgi:hypothetical protein